MLSKETRGHDASISGPARDPVVISGLFPIFWISGVSLTERFGPKLSDFKALLPFPPVGILVAKSACVLCSLLRIQP